MTGHQLRETFLRYFESKGHARVASSSLVPAGDPTLLFTNAGMVQFKDVFLGLDRRPYRRAVTAQKCVRASGKHNDLEDVGRTARHNTFFEMLGNFSFGDYFKREAIAYAWEFVTEVMGLEPDTLWATIYRDDEEAFQHWQGVAGLPPERVVRLGEKDNFWAMGDTGPCGPCSEIVVDRGEVHRCDAEVCGIGACDCDRWRELWNLVFMQFNRDESGTLTPLPRPSIDTGMGLERAVSITENCDSIYETDLLLPIIRATERLSGVEYRPYPDPAGVPFRVIADHARCCTFVVADGVVPSNEGRGYVLRRILRRAARYGRSLGLDGPFLYRLVPVVASGFGEVYPEVRDGQEYVSQVIRQEEQRFGETLESGLRRATEIVEATRARGDRQISGRDAFLLYDTFGFPVESTEDIANEHGLTVDRAGFEAAMEEQRRRAREAWEAGAGRTLAPELVAALEGVPATEFVGYDYECLDGTEATVLALVRDNQRVDRVGEAEAHDAEVLVVLDRTPFYAEAGGQVGDTGTLRVTGGHGEARVVDTHRLPSGAVAHRAQVERGSLARGDRVMAMVDTERRWAVMRNHTATHLLHRALKDVLGEHANQAGSLVAPDRLRFDFTHHSPLEPEAVARIESLVNASILADREVRAYHATLEEARAQGAVALFGEKYGDVVRVVEIDGVSRELCGGTHVPRTGQLGLFKLTGESSVAAGVRRVEAVTGTGVLELLERVQGALEAAASLVKASPADLAVRVEGLLRQLRERERELEALRSRVVRDEVADLIRGARFLGDVRVVAGTVEAGDADALRATADLVRDALGSGVVILAAAGEGRAHFVTMVTRDLVARGLDAGKIVREVARAAGGGGGGRPDMAQAGARDPARIDEALARGLDTVRGQLGLTA